MPDQQEIGQRIEPGPQCESCGAGADVKLDDGSTWCDECDRAAREYEHSLPDIEVVTTADTTAFEDALVEVQHAMAALSYRMYLNIARRGTMRLQLWRIVNDRW